MTRQRTLRLGMLSVGMLFLLASLATSPAHAASATQTISQGLDTAAQGTYSTGLNLPVFIGRIIQFILSATGLVFLGITVYAGILYMTAAGESEKVKKAKGMLTNSVIGIVIIVGAYAISSYVISALATAAAAPSTVTTECDPEADEPC